MPVELESDYLVASLALMEATSTDMMAHRNDAYPEEAVGILCGDGSSYPLINQLRSGKAFAVSQVLLKEAVEMLKDVGKMPVAMYHSHPETTSGPSKRDILMMQNMVGALSVIVGIDGIAGWLWNERLHSVGKIPLPDEGT